MFNIIRSMYSLNKADRFGRDVGKLLPFAIDGCCSLSLDQYETIDECVKNTRYRIVAGAMALHLH
jgi:hypothetical protein